MEKSSSILNQKENSSINWLIKLYVADVKSYQYESSNVCKNLRVPTSYSFISLKFTNTLDCFCCSCRVKFIAGDCSVTVSGLLIEKKML